MYRSLLAIFFVLILAGTVLDLWNQHKVSRLEGDSAKELLKRQRENRWGSYLVGFSFYTNSKRLLDTSPGKPGQVMNCQFLTSDR